MANQYTSYYLYQKYEKRGSQDWLPCYPNVFSVDGDGTMPLVIKTENDPDCGYTPPTEPIYRWYNIPITTDYVCDVCPAVEYRWTNKDINAYYECVGTDKYYVQKRQYSYDSGSTWNDVVPEETQRGSLYESDSTDCGYIPPIEPQYRTTSGTPYCTGYDLYVDVYSQVSYDGGTTWEITATTATLVEADSTQCGYIEPQYRTTSGTPYCEGTDKYVPVYSQVSYDGGLTWETTATTSSLTEFCSSDCIAHIQPIDMTGKLYIGKYYDGSTHRSYNCSSDPVQRPNLIAPETTGYQDKNVADTGAFGTGIDPYIYIGSCPHGVAAYAFRSYGGTSIHKCGVSFYFDSGLTSFCFSTGALIATNVREVVLGNSSMTFSAGDEAFSGASGDISVITSRLTSAGEKCFMEGNFGGTVTFDKTITLYNKAFYWSNFQTLVFNSGFTIGSSSIQETFWGKYGATYTIVLNGSMEDYDNPNIANILRGYGHTVIDNRPEEIKYIVNYDYNGSAITRSGNCSSDSTLTSADTHGNYSSIYVVSAGIGTCVTNIGNRAFAGCTAMTSCTIGSGVTIISTYAFSGCRALTSIDIPSSVTLIGDDAFSDCRGLLSVVIPNSVTSIGEYAFYNCYGLTSCTIGSGVTSISNDAFYNCNSLTGITIEATTPPTLGYEAFEGTNNCPIYVPCGSVEAYKTASGWSVYGSRITCYSQYRTISGTPYCTGYDLYVDVYSQVSYDSGSTWDTTATTTTLVEYNSTQCGYIAYRWVDSGTTCVGYDKYQQAIKQQSTDGGWTWTNVTPPEYSATTVIEANSPDCGYVPPTPYENQYLTFVAEESGTFRFSESISYSLDSGSTWNGLAKNTNSPSVAVGQKIMWKGNKTPSSTSSPYGIGTFSSTGRFSVEGNPHSLLWGDNFVGQTDLTGKKCAFYSLFSYCTGLTSASGLRLPATTLSDNCYYGMFGGCGNLTTVPSNLLPATTMKSYCYYAMFNSCTNLTEAPQLPATTLDYDCYTYMFAGCTSITTAPELPATTLGYGCYYGMFTGCTSLTTAPVLSATTLASQCYYAMFQDCTSLNSITCLATDISASNCTTNWVRGVAASGTFTKAASMTSWTTGTSGIPSGWTVQDA